MKLKVPLVEHYDCKKIIKYKDEVFDMPSEYMMINYEDDDGICFTVKHF